MHGAVEGEEHAEDRQPDEQGRPRGQAQGQGAGDAAQGHDEREGRPPDVRGARRQAAGRPAPQEPRRRGLHHAVADDPQGKRAADLGVREPQGARQEHGQRQHEPDVTRAEQEQARGREPVDARVAGQDLGEGDPGRGAPRGARQEDGRDHERQGQHCGQSLAGALEAQAGQEEAAQEEAGALERVLRARQQRHPPHQSALVRVRHDQLDVALRAHLGQVLGDPAQALGDQHQGYAQARGLRGQEREGEHLQGEPGEERRLQTEARSQPAADEVRQHAEELVEQEQRRDLERRAPELVQPQEHEHAQGAVGQREDPVGQGDRGVVADVAHRALSAWSQRPCRPAPPGGWRSPIRCRTRPGP